MCVFQRSSWNAGPCPDIRIKSVFSTSSRGLSRGGPLPYLEVPRRALPSFRGSEICFIRRSFPRQLSLSPSLSLFLCLSLSLATPPHPFPLEVKTLSDLRESGPKAGLSTSGPLSLCPLPRSNVSPGSGSQRPRDATGVPRPRENAHPPWNPSRILGIGLRLCPRGTHLAQMKSQGGDFI